MDILLKENLNHIKIITQRGTQYIFVYEKDCRRHETKFRDKSSYRMRFGLSKGEKYSSYSEYSYKNKIYSE